MINVVIVATNQSRFSTMQVVCKVVDIKYSIHQKIDNAYCQFSKQARTKYDANILAFKNFDILSYIIDLKNYYVMKKSQ